MKPMKFMLKFAFLACMVFLTGCPGPNNTQPEVPAGMVGFYLQTWVADFTIPTTGREAYVTVTGNWDHNIQSNPGSTQPFQQQTDNTGLEVVLRAAPATWKITWNSDGGFSQNGHLCNGLFNYFASEQYQEMDVTCEIFGGSINIAGAAPTFVFSPEPVYQNAPPSVGTIGGGNAGSLTTTYGMPVVQYYDTSGTLQAQESASYVSPDGTWMQISAFDISQLSAGFYIGYIYNVNSSGGLDSVGVVQTDLATSIPWCRFRNPSSGDYFYDTYCSTPSGYVYEGVASYLFTSQIEDTVPLYRLMNPSLGMHFYTASYDEMYNDVNYYGWVYESTPGYVAFDQIGGTTPLYRLSKNNGSHLFTTSWSEVQSATWNYGFVYEGVAGYVPMQ